MKHIVCTVSNDLSYDQRMQRTCATLAENGFRVTLVGRRLAESKPLETLVFEQKRLPCFFRKGFPFYAELNLRLFFFLLFAHFDAICTVDLDTMPAGCLATVLRRKKRVFDAHEHFTEVPELQGRFFVKKFWETVARLCLPFYQQAYTVGPGLADIFEKEYGQKFAVVRNVPLLESDPKITPPAPLPRILLYQGALNEGRGIEQAIEAMSLLHDTNVELWLAGEGDLSVLLREKAAQSPARDRIRFLGYVRPADLKKLTAQAWLGLNLLENKGLSYYYSLANKFFDYTQAAVPGLTMDFPEYRALCEEYPCAVLLDELSPEKIAEAVRQLLENESAYENLRAVCRKARLVWNWDFEKQRLLEIWRSVW